MGENMVEKSVRFGSLQLSIIALTVITGVIHLAVGALLFSPPNLLFVLNGVGYLVLVALLYWPSLKLGEYRNLIRWILMVYAAVTVFAWIFIGVRSPLAYLDKVVEVALIVLLWLEGQQENRG